MISYDGCYCSSSKILNNCFLVLKYFRYETHCNVHVNWLFLFNFFYIHRVNTFSVHSWPPATSGCPSIIRTVNVVTPRKILSYYTLYFINTLVHVYVVNTTFILYTISHLLKILSYPSHELLARALLVEETVLYSFQKPYPHKK